MSQPPEEPRDGDHPSPAGRTGSTSSRSSWPSRSGHEGQHSSGESSGGSRIDSTDRWRFGGPGCLPDWPLSHDYSELGVSADHANAAVQIATTHLNQKALDYELVRVAKRFSTGAAPSQSDTTVIIDGDLSTRYSEWLSALDDVLIGLSELEWPGRVEMVDVRASKVHSFPPRLAHTVSSSWANIRQNVIDRLSAHNMPWVMVFILNRGYWDEISAPTVIAKIDAPIRSPAWNSIVVAASRDIKAYLSEFDICIEISDTEGLWGPFSSSRPDQTSLFGAPTFLGSTSPLGWPFDRGYNTIGMSVGREGVKALSGTLGGYLEFHDPNGNIKRRVGLTCYHVVRFGPHGQEDLNVQRNGGVRLGYPCQSPAAADMEDVTRRLNNVIHSPVHHQLPPFIASQAQRDRDEASCALSEVNQYQKHIGTVLAASGWRNVQAPPSSSIPDDILVDWACVELSRNMQWPQCSNYIGDVGIELQNAQNPAAASWTTRDQFISNAARMPAVNTFLFKRGQSTGLTAGNLGPLTPAAYRIPNVPGSHHHLAYTVSSADHNPFAGPGDSGAWCLDGDGKLVGILIAGDTSRNIGLMTPIETVVEDIERMLRLPADSLGFIKSSE